MPPPRITTHKSRLSRPDFNRLSFPGHCCKGCCLQSCPPGKPPCNQSRIAQNEQAKAKRRQVICQVPLESKLWGNHGRHARYSISPESGLNLARALRAEIRQYKRIAAVSTAMLGLKKPAVNQ